MIVKQVVNDEKNSPGPQTEIAPLLFQFVCLPKRFCLEYQAEFI